MSADSVRSAGFSGESPGWGLWFTGLTLAG